MTKKLTAKQRTLKALDDKFFSKFAVALSLQIEGTIALGGYRCDLSFQDQNLIIKEQDLEDSVIMQNKIKELKADGIWLRFHTLVNGFKVIARWSD
jgi:hypothetical protein